MVALFAALALLVGLVRFWRGTGEHGFGSAEPGGVADRDQRRSRLKYLDGGGWGCAYPDEKSSQSRRWFHHFTFYGFLLCFAATSLGRSTTTFLAG